VQYPGADEALRSDLRQLQRFSRLLQAMMPGTEIKPLLQELSDRMTEELDYRIEADHQRAFAKAFAGDRHVLVPRVVASAPKVIVSEWASGLPLASIIRDGDKELRDRVGYLLAEFQYSAPARVGLLHADPHPGNFMLTEDGRLCVIDYGAAAALPNGLPPIHGRMMRLALDGKSEELLDLLRESHFVRAGTEIQAEDVYAYLAPFVEPVRSETFHFTRRWMQRQAGRVSDMRGQDFRTGRSLNLPPRYLMLHRVLGGSTGILCQLDAELPVRELITRWQPGFAD
jgi:predicted unusual protein kinase regulating ubiquinone biosynthesis (AarF/ABC1/UbiB family)